MTLHMLHTDVRDKSNLRLHKSFVTCIHNCDAMASVLHCISYPRVDNIGLRQFPE